MHALGCLVPNVYHSTYGLWTHFPLEKINLKNKIILCAMTRYETIALNPILGVIGYLDV